MAAKLIPGKLYRYRGAQLCARTETHTFDIPNDACWLVLEVGETDASQYCECTVLTEDGVICTINPGMHYAERVL